MALGLYALLRFYFGPLAQDPAYHVLADTRMCGPIPRAGDVLTNLAILAAGVAGIVLWGRARVEIDEIACLLLLRRGRHDGTAWLVAALVLDAVMTVCERMDYPIFAATGGIASGHNLKHILAGMVLGCVVVWLLRRRRR